MVTLRRPINGKTPHIPCRQLLKRWWTCYPLVSALLISVGFFYDFGVGWGEDLSMTTTTQPTIQLSPQSHVDEESFKSLLDSNVKAMKLWRLDLRSKCQSIINHANRTSFSDKFIQEKLQIETEAISKLLPHSLDVAKGNDFAQVSQDSRSQRQSHVFCKTVFIDLGTNRGDSIAYAVDAALDVCTPLWLRANPSSRKDYRSDKAFPHPHFDFITPTIQNVGSKPGGLLNLLRQQSIASNTSPEELCVYGMEGNPYFTQSLKNLQDFVYRLNPRPIRHLHIHTESVVTDHDGPTQLYVDQHSEKNHFWGSSLIQSMPDVRKTAQRNERKEYVVANVTGISLSTLIQKVMAPLNPKATDQSKHGSNLLIKMDVEGAEYSILKEVAATGVLCRYVQLGNNATLSVEVHANKMRSQADKDRALDGYQAAKAKLQQCGVQFKKLPSYWTD